MNYSSYSRAYGSRILLVEDNLSDVRLVQEAFTERKIKAQLSVARDGEEASEMLRHASGQETLPDLVLLDLNLPRKTGQELLCELKNNPQLRHIPVVVLTSSSADSDVVAAYDSQANSYVVKPVQLEEFFELIANLVHFWLDVVQLPPRRALAVAEAS